MISKRALQFHIAAHAAHQLGYMAQGYGKSHKAHPFQGSLLPVVDQVAALKRAKLVVLDCEGSSRSPEKPLS